MFSTKDFSEEKNRVKLNAIIMDKLMLCPLTPFSKLEGHTLKRKYNTELQQYIKSLDDNWNETIILWVIICLQVNFNQKIYLFQLFLPKIK